MNAPNLDVRLGAPTATHWLGTDRIGRDVLTRIIAGSRVSLQVAAGAVLMALMIGAPLGALGSYVGGKIDALVQRVMEGIMAFPSLVLALALVALAGPSVVMLWFAIAFSSVPRYARLVRSGVLTQKEREYVLAARAMGQSPLRILIKQILPNIMAPIAVQVTLGLCSGHQCGSVAQLPWTWLVRPLHQLGHDDPGRPRLFGGRTLVGDFSWTRPWQESSWPLPWWVTPCATAWTRACAGA